VLISSAIDLVIPLIICLNCYRTTSVLTFPHKYHLLSFSSFILLKLVNIVVDSKKQSIHLISIHFSTERSGKINIRLKIGTFCLNTRIKPTSDIDFRLKLRVLAKKIIILEKNCVSKKHANSISHISFALNDCDSSKEEKNKQKI
jgi:hypothetical protein